jgi:murein DD-endopeptidase MepM/ murein hydrolase activator NlpD
MSSDRIHRLIRRLIRRVAAAALILPLILALSPTPAAQSISRDDLAPQSGDPARSASADLAQWSWPTPSHHVVVPYSAPATRYGPGHRGIDISAPIGVVVTAPDAGIVAFAGRVAGRSVLTIDHGAGLVSTLEPVVSGLTTGATVRAGDEVGVVGVGGPAADGTLHLGARRDGEYMNPLLLLGGIPHAVLLPCCS